ncbi:MAG: hypothetical protein IOMNBAOH_00973 [Rhodocyclaceae bacterium]|nr:hypothetical protein [Rhodocyclaceae bacterium]
MKMRYRQQTLSCALMLLAGGASAHVSYTGRDLIANGTFDGTSHTLSAQTVTGRYGWADAADSDWGDSHRGRFMKFTLTGSSDITITIQRQAGVAVTVGPNNPSGIALDDLAPAFSLYAGIVPVAAYEGSDHPLFLASHAGYLPGTTYYSTTHAGPLEGAWNGLGDFTLGNKSSEVGAAGWAATTLTFLGDAIDGSTSALGGDGMADGLVSRQFHGLAAGTYTVVVGGACYECQIADANGLDNARGFSASLQVAPVPEPGLPALFLAGLGLTVWQLRRPKQPANR